MVMFKIIQSPDDAEPVIAGEEGFQEILLIPENDFVHQVSFRIVPGRIDIVDMDDDARHPGGSADQLRKLVGGLCVLHLGRRLLAE